mgnify:FL=1
MDTIFNKIDHFLTRQCDDFDELDETQPEHKALMDAIELLVEIQESPVAYIPFASTDITDVKLKDMASVELMPNTRVKRVDDRVYLTGEGTTNE